VIRFRPEAFGGVLHLARPRALVFVDHALAGHLGFRTAAPDGPAPAGPLSAPLEVHLNLSERCGAGCRHCYVDARPDGPILDPARVCRILDALAAARVFHVALGGGEPLEYPSLIEVAHHARARGLVPNLTTSGRGLTPALARAMDVFGQINVSLDGLGPAYAALRGRDGFAEAEHALAQLRAVRRRVGVNLVVARSSFASIGPVVRWAKRLRLSEVELLRLKPGGRAGAAYAAERPTARQLDALLPRVHRLALRYRMPIRLDCSFLPAICATDPDPRLLEFFQVRGCEAGNLLASVDARGRLQGCSFAPWTEGPAEELAARWTATSAFEPFRGLERRLPEPCASCRYLALCRGGCRAVAVWETGDPLAPDPDCPRVRVASSRAGRGDRGVADVAAEGADATL